MTEPTERALRRRRVVAFAVPLAWLAVAGVWIALGITDRDPLRLGMAVVWIAFAVVWAARAMRQLRELRSRQTG